MDAEDTLVGYRANVVFGGCDPACVSEPGPLLRILAEASEAAGFTVVERVSHKFEPYGITCAIILSQSHLIGHSWPEHDALVVNIFTCGDSSSIDAAISAINDGVQAEWMTSEIKEQLIRKLRLGEPSVNSVSAIDKKAPGIGVAIVIWQNSARECLLLGLGHSAANREEIYAVPGGHWESGETLTQAVNREAEEEAGVTATELKLISVYEFFNPEKNKSYVTIGFEGILADGSPEVREPENKVDWGWYTPEEALKLPLFAPDKVLIQRAVSGVLYEIS